MPATNPTTAPCHPKDESSSGSKIFRRRLPPSPHTSDTLNQCPNLLVRPLSKIGVKASSLKPSTKALYFAKKSEPKSPSKVEPPPLRISATFRQSTTSATQVPCHQYLPSILDTSWCHHRNNTVTSLTIGIVVHPYFRSKNRRQNSNLLLVKCTCCPSKRTTPTPSKRTDYHQTRW